MHKVARCWFGHLVRMPPGCLPLEVLGTIICEEAPEQTQSSLNGLSHLAWERLKISQEELESVSGERDVGIPC